METSPADPVDPYRPPSAPSARVVHTDKNRPCAVCQKNVMFKQRRLCPSCQARHHRRCWTERGACGACGSTEANGAGHDYSTCYRSECELPCGWNDGSGPARWCEAHAHERHSQRFKRQITVAAIPFGLGLALAGLSFMGRDPSLVPAFVIFLIAGVVVAAFAWLQSLRPPTAR